MLPDCLFIVILYPVISKISCKDVVLYLLFIFLSRAPIPGDLVSDTSEPVT